MKSVLLVFDQSAFLMVAGLPALTRALCAGRKSGVNDWLVLATENTKDCKRLIVDEPRLRGLRAIVVQKDQLSQKALTEWLGEEAAIVLPCSVIFDHRFLRQIVDCRESASSAVVSRNSESVVGVTGDAVALWSLLQEEGLWRKDSSLPVIPLSEGLWAPLHLGQQEVERRLFASLGRDTDGFLARALDRKVSRAITRRLAHTSVTPNQITLFSFALGLFSAWLLMQPQYWSRVSGAALLLVSTTMDGCDGELARLKFLESDFGAKFDLIADNIVHLLLFPGLAVSLYRETQSPLYTTLAFVTLLGVLCSMAVAYVAIFRSSSGLAGKAEKRTPLMEFYERITGRDFAYVLLLLAIADRLSWFLWAAAIGTYVFAGGLLLVYGFRERIPAQQ